MHLPIVEEVVLFVGQDTETTALRLDVIDGDFQQRAHATLIPRAEPCRRHVA